VKNKKRFLTHPRTERRHGFPIRGFVDEPQIFPTTIISNAAGAALEWINGKSVNKTVTNDRGVASILHRGGKILKTAPMSRPGNLLKNKNGSYFSTKRGTLEAVGLILPFISYPAELTGKRIVLQVDNTSLIYGWEKHYCKNDAETSLLLQVLHVIEVYLPCKKHMQHVSRCLTTMAKVVYQLSRKSSTTEENI
jgi:hypothetical protein